MTKKGNFVYTNLELGMDFDIIQEGKFTYVEQGEGPPLLLLHGLFGALSNFSSLIKLVHSTSDGVFWSVVFNNS